MTVFVVEPQFQLPPRTPTSPFDCTAYSASMAARYAKSVQSGPSGRTIRLLSDEAKPDPESPGLNIPQVADVLIEHFGVFLEQHVGGRALTWAQYEAKRLSGRGALIQVSYAAIADSPFDAGRGFRSNHCMWEDAQATDDPLSDGRAKGVYDRLARGPIVYPRELVKRAAGMLVTGESGARAGFGKVWCAFTRDTVPVFRVEIRPAKGHQRREYVAYTVKGGVITGRTIKRTTGFEAACSIPRVIKWPGKGLRYVVQVKPDPGDPNHHVGEWVADHWSAEA